MNEFIYVAIGIFGAIFGSFASAVIPRIREKQDFVKARSECPSCHHPLGILDLFPVLSYMGLRGKCRYCQAKIPPYHFLLELSMAAGFVVVAMMLVDMDAIILGSLSELATMAFLLVAMFITVVFTAYDLMYWEIPDEFMLPFLILTFLLLGGAHLLPYQPFGYFLPFENALLNVPLQQAFLGALPIFLFFYLQIQLSDGKWLGGGDLRIALFMGFVAGAKIAWLGLFLSYIIGSIIGIVMLLIHRQRGMQVPFGPFLALGLWTALIWHEPILDWYFSLVIV